MEMSSVSVLTHATVVQA